MTDSTVEYEKLIFEHPDKGYQLKLVVNNFRDIDYVHFRKYFLSFDEGYLPSKEGVSMPMSIANVYAMLDGLMEICAKAEGLDAVEEHFSQLIEKLT